MKPILLVHGYASEGRAKSPADIYATLPAELRKTFAADVVR